MEVLANTPDITIINMKHNICIFTDVATPSDNNVIKRELKTI
jgi:hypothetical protein